MFFQDFVENNEELETNIVEDDEEFEFMCEKYEKLMCFKPKIN